MPYIPIKLLNRIALVACVGALVACNQASPQKLTSTGGDENTAVPAGGSPSDSAGATGSDAQNPGMGNQAAPMPLPPAGNRGTPNDTASDNAEAPPSSPANPDSTTPGNTIPQDVTPQAPGVNSDAAPPAASTSSAADQVSTEESVNLQARSFATIGKLNSTDPTELLQHVAKVDEALREVVLLGNNGLLSRQQYQQAGQRLGQLKMFTAQSVLDSADASAEQTKAAKIAKLVALSHLSGLQDVASAQKLREFAQELTQDADADVAHQGRVVLLGFEVQALANGLTKDPSLLSKSCALLLDAPERRKFPEYVAVQNAAVVMNQLGHTDVANETADMLANAYIDSEDRNLRGEAWLLLTRSSPISATLNTTQSDVTNGKASSNDLAAAARRLLEEFPYGVAAEKLASMLGELDASGQVQASALLVDTIEQAAGSIAIAPFQTANVETLIAEHQRRFNLIGAPLTLTSVADFSGQPIDQASLKGKVVLVDFWASWCINCVEEMKNIESIYSDYHDNGFEVVGVCLDEKLSDGEAFVRNRSLPWLQAVPTSSALAFDSDIAQNFGVDRIPFTLLVDRDGTVRMLNSRGTKLRRDVEALLQ